MSQRQWIPVTGLVATMLFAIYMVVQLSGQTPAPTADFTNAAVAEVRDAQGQVVLQGQFVAEEADADIESKATLKPTTGVGASGEAELEFAKASPTTQEVEFSVRGLQAGATFTFVIDGQEVATASTDRSGNAEVDLDVSMPGSVAK